MEQFSRTEMLLGRRAMERLYSSKIAVFGAGGVGGYCIEALARSGAGRLDLFDPDTICPSNINRQIIATYATLGQFKVDAFKERIALINPSATVNAHKLFYSARNAHSVDLSAYDYIVDAIDTVASKAELAARAQEAGAAIISAMGTGNKRDPSAFRVADIYQTSVCPLARVMRHELKRRGVERLKVVYSTEPPARAAAAAAQDGAPDHNADSAQQQPLPRKITPASNSFVPAAAGLILAGEVIKDLIAAL